MRRTNAFGARTCRRTRLRMALPLLRVMLRHVRPRRARTIRATEHRVGGALVTLPSGRPAPVTVDGRHVGTADVRHDYGSSTLEVWTRLDDAADATLVASALTDLVREVGAHRLAWSLRHGSVEQQAATAAGLVREGAVTPPRALAGVPHELWAAVGPWA